MDVLFIYELFFHFLRDNGFRVLKSRTIIEPTQDAIQLENNIIVSDIRLNPPNSYSYAPNKIVRIIRNTN